MGNDVNPNIQMPNIKLPKLGELSGAKGINVPKGAVPLASPDAGKKPGENSAVAANERQAAERIQDVIVGSLPKAAVEKAGGAEAVMAMMAQSGMAVGDTKNNAFVAAGVPAPIASESKIKEGAINALEKLEVGTEMGGDTGDA